MNRSNRRTHPRYCLNLDVNLVPPGREVLGCSVRDFCLGGLFVQVVEDFARDHRETLDSLRSGDEVAVEYVAPNNKRLTIPSRIAHVAGLGIGIQFVELNDQALDGLLQTASLQQEAEQRLLPLAEGHEVSDKKDLLPLIKDVLERFVISLFHDYYETTVDTLFERAGKANSNAEQGEMFEAMDAVNKSRDGAFKTVWDGMAQQFDAFVDNRPLYEENPKPGSSAELSLVEMDEFQNWLAVTGLVSKLESRYDDALFAIEKRLGHVVGRSIQASQNPLAPAAVCRFFQDLITQFDVSDSAKQLVQQAFQQTIGKRVGLFFDDLNDLFIAYDILPVVERDMRFVKSESSAAAPEAESPENEAIDEETGSEQNDSADGGATPAGTGMGRGLGRGMGRAPSTPSNEGAGGRSGSVNGQGPADEGSIAQPARPSLAGAMHLMDMQSGLGSTDAGTGPAQSEQGMPGSSAVAEASAPSETGAASASGQAHFSNSEIISALNNVSHELQAVRDRRSEGQDLLAQLRESLSQLPGADGAKTISPEAGRSIEVVDGLMGSIQGDHISNEWSKSSLGRLEMPLAKSALVDNRVLTDADGSAAELINRLDQVGSFFTEGSSQQTKQLQDDVAQIVDDVAKNAGENPEAYEEALTQLDTLYEKARRDYEVHVSGVRRESEEKYRIECQRKELLDILDEAIGNQKIPLIVARILDAGWKNLLLRTYVREGRQGKSFRAYFEIINQLLAILTNDDKWISEKRWTGETVLELVRRGLSHVPLPEDKLNNLMDMLGPQIQMAVVEPESIEMTVLPSLKEVMEKKQREQLKKQIAGRYEEDAWKAAQDSVASMAEGDVLSIADANGRKQQHKLIWSSEDREHFVFVDGEGAKSYEFKLNDLADKILSKEASIVEGLDVPLMDRASYSMLMSIHNKLLNSSNFDALTGLLNRRSYELSLNRVLEKSRIDKSKSLICYFDLDRFNVVNNACGHEAGDRLLCQIAEILNSSFPGCEVIARAGDDEFGLIMEDASRTEGLQKVKALQETFHQHQFHCEDQEFTVSASFALVEISAQTESVRSLLSAVDSACFTAKEAGRDRIEIYHADNEAILRRDGMLNWVGQINRLFDGDHIQLRAQRIYPLGSVGEGYSHYEILLSVKDDNGRPVSNEQFIQAAEIYNRIIDIDRWVVEHAMGWLESLLSSGKKMPVISINLSGRSLNNKSFMDDMDAMIRKTPVPARHFCFEVTETAAIGNLGQATHFIKKIKALGCQFSLDDFGTGMSSYSYLKALPVDFLKIDGSFVKNIITDLNDQAVVKSINEIGHAMGKKTVAEYVENDEILQLLREMGVDYAQGYTIEKPTLLSELVIA